MIKYKKEANTRDNQLTLPQIKVKFMTIQVKFKRVFEYFFLINYATNEMKSKKRPRRPEKTIVRKFLFRFEAP